MSLWGYNLIALNANLIYSYLFQILDCLGNIYTNLNIFKTGLEYDSLLYGISISTLNKSCRIRSDKSIGPHNKDILSIFYGSLLGDGYAEKRANGTRISFYQEASHVSYLIWQHNFLSNLGYCNTNLPKINTRLGKYGKIRKIIRFHTWTYSSLNWLHELWYVNGIKVVPNNVGEFLSPLALAIWIMEDGGKVNKSLKLSTNSFTYSECLFLSKVLLDNFDLKSSVQSAGVKNQYIIYILNESINDLRNIVLPYIHSSMKYKLYN
jgi:ubiquinol-cytochrome c reductase cytochrome b subunit